MQWFTPLFLSVLGWSKCHQTLLPMLFRDLTQPVSTMHLHFSFILPEFDEVRPLLLEMMKSTPEEKVQLENTGLMMSLVAWGSSLCSQRDWNWEKGRERAVFKEIWLKKNKSIARTTNSQSRLSWGAALFVKDNIMFNSVKILWERCAGGKVTK